LFIGAVLGSKRGGLSLMQYIQEGMIGLPVFAGGTGSMAILFGLTAGYLIGFIPAAILMEIGEEWEYCRLYLEMENS
jgi:biotin transport system substrate-specific component